MEWEFQVWQNGLAVAEGSGPDKDAMWREGQHYLSQYGQDGPATLLFGQGVLPLPPSEEGK